MYTDSTVYDPLNALPGELDLAYHSLLTTVTSRSNIMEINEMQQINLLFLVMDINTLVNFKMI